MSEAVGAAALVLADHPFLGRVNGNAPGRCGCWLDTFGKGWQGMASDHPAHLAEVLAAAGLLRPEGDSNSSERVCR